MIARCPARLLCALVIAAGCGNASSNMIPGGTGGGADSPWGFDPVFPPPEVVAPNRPPRRSSAITDENQRPGDPSWQITYAAANHEVEGYGARMTLAAGDPLDVHLNVDRPRNVTWAVYRLGWYGGAGGRKLDAGGPIAVVPQPACPHDSVTQRVECHWATAFTWRIPADALAGVYLVKLTADGMERYVPFVVYDGRPADIVMNVNVSSWQAYNDFGGESLYEDASGTMPHGKAWEVSYDRPFNESFGAGRLLYWEVHALRFIEALGYDVTYTTALDLTHDPLLPLQTHMFLSIANDEYWTVGERDAVEHARDRGINLAFLGADQALWRIRLQPSSAGVPDRVIVCYKADQDRDPVLAKLGPSASTARFRDDPDARPENGVIGVMYNTWLLVPQPMVVSDPTHWVFAGTGLRAGDTLPGIIVGETDTLYANGYQPSGLQVFAATPLADAEGGPWHAHAASYTHASGAEVIAAGTFGWAAGLSPEQGDPRVARMVRNVLDRFSHHTGAPDPVGAPWSSLVVKPQVIGAWAQKVSTLAGRPVGPTETVVPLDGPGAQARFTGPDGIAVAADGSIYVADAWAHQIRKIANDALHTVSTYAGDGIDGMIDGPGAQARFRFPAGLALAPNGTLYVADADNHVIRAIAPDAAHTVSTYAGAPTRSGGFGDGPGVQAEFNRPVALALDGTGALYVADEHNCRIRKIATDTAHTVTTFAGSIIGEADGPALQAQLNNPTGVAVAADGTVYVLDTFNQSIRRIGTDAAHTVVTLAGGGARVGLVDGPGSSAQLGTQGGLALLNGRLYASDVAAQRIRVIVPGVDAASTQVMTFAGSGRTALEDGPGATASLAAPQALAAGNGVLYLADSGNLAVRALLP